MVRLLTLLFLIAVSDLQAEPLRTLPVVPQLLEDVPHIPPKEVISPTQSLQSLQPLLLLQPEKTEKRLLSASPSLIVNPEVISNLKPRTDSDPLRTPMNQLEEPPMRNTLKKISFSSILGALMLAASPSTAAEPTLGELKILLDSIDKRLDTLEKPRRNSDGNILLKEPIGGEEIVTPGVTVHDMKKMQEEIVMLKKRVMELESRPVRIVRDESKLIRDPAVSDLTRLAKVKFRNDWIEEVSILVNGISYEILPGFERTISVPAGVFTYQVLDLQRRPQTRILEADKTWTVQINTRN